MSSDFKAKTRKWGNSIGIVLPLEVVRKEDIRAGQIITVLIAKRDSKLLEKWFGTIKFDKSTQEIKDELRRELHGEK